MSVFLTYQHTEQARLGGYFAGKQNISSHLFSFPSIIPLWHPDPTCRAQRSTRTSSAALGTRVVSALGHQGMGWGHPQAFSLACAWTEEAPCDLWRDTHAPAVWPGIGSREASGLLFTPGLLLSLDFLCNSEIKPSELILSRGKRERGNLSSSFGAALEVLIDLYVTEGPPNHRNKFIQYLLHVTPGSRSCYNSCTSSTTCKK